LQTPFRQRFIHAIQPAKPCPILATRTIGTPSIARQVAKKIAVSQFENGARALARFNAQITNEVEAA
jgi:hypothetical protein